MGSGGGKSKNNYKNPIRLTIGVEGAWFGAMRGYASPRGTVAGDLSLDQFLEVVAIEPEKDVLPGESLPQNAGHPLYRPFMLRRHGHNVGLAESSALAYDNVTTRHRAYMQLEEGMRVIATGTLDLLDDLDLEIGDTISVDATSMGVRRTFLIDGIEESHDTISFNLIDVIGG